jgi:excisionase family DNA binding protein
VIPVQFEKEINMPDLSKFLTEKDAAKLLAICERTLYEARKRGDLPFYKFGRAVRYSPEDLKAWTESQKSIGVPAES